MAQDSLAEIVEACNEMTVEELSEPSLESENAYRSEEIEPSEDQKDAIDRITEE